MQVFFFCLLGIYEDEAETFNLKLPNKTESLSRL